MTTRTIDFDHLRSAAHFVKRRPDRSYRYAVLHPFVDTVLEVLSWHRTPNAAREAVNRNVRRGLIGVAAYEVTEDAR